jgi:ubiquinone/menaquinone biosynthesis C-methylase UbiE
MTEQAAMNFFVHKTAAERYAKYRPYFHPLVVEKVRAYLHLERPAGVAVDVGCGSGQSTVALKEISDFVAGMDISAEMLRLASKQPGIQYIQASAEEMAIKDASADLLATSLAHHWFDQERFFQEAGRVLKDRAWLIISNNGFSGQMVDDVGFEQWIVQAYESRYPSPPRNSVAMTQEFARLRGFYFAHQEEYQNTVSFSAEELAAYLTTQSNVIAATEQGREKVEDIQRWIMTQTKPFFRTAQATFVFGGYIWYLQKAS